MKKYLPLIIAVGLNGFCVSAMSAPTPSETITSQTQSITIHINSASQSELEKIPGIGKKKAKAIIDYRKKHGKFTSMEELTRVKGIGKKMVLKMPEHVGI